MCGILVLAASRVVTYLSYHTLAQAFHFLFQYGNFQAVKCVGTDSLDLRLT